jgi:hypothetical protein
MNRLNPRSKRDLSLAVHCSLPDRQPKARQQAPQGLYPLVLLAANIDPSYFVFFSLPTPHTLPDDIPSFPLVAGEIELGVSAISEAGNESEITKFRVFIDLIVPEPPTNLRLEDLQDKP